MLSLSLSLSVYIYICSLKKPITQTPKKQNSQPFMAVEARHLNFFPPQLITNRDLVNNNGGIAGTYETQMGSGVDFAGSTFARRTLFPFHPNSLWFGTLFRVPQSELSSFLGREDIPLQIHQQQLDIDFVVAQHAKKIRLELEERQKQQARMLVSAIGEGIKKKLIEKDEQIQRMGKLNWVLQERVNNLYLESQLWKDLAQSNEATANSLRTNLHQVLAHVADGGRAAVAETDDAESCCGSNEKEEEGGERREVVVVGGGGGGGGMCRKCGERESRVVLLPCRHLCLCSGCGSTLIHTCPALNESNLLNSPELMNG
ncbi:hypothetical protein TEA_006836 [Camellia sinensis var. sinensis]|uniref:RING-type domain-containing protein n=1 Tax=Camellia sinensis var. sinensis TaxID=542762 RepID=A0A4S4EN00_CAMSN|nr:hypothetical protein TEA_006836 [Camellia sinensis var. sinensis]